MRAFSCQVCHQSLFFENITCLGCGSRIAFIPELQLLTALEQIEDGLYRVLALEAEGNVVRLCANGVEYGVCNWAVSADDSATLCCSCRLNTTIPNLNEQGAMDAWSRMEVAKRRLIYTLYDLNLPVEAKWEHAGGVAFSFEKPLPNQPVFTGHNDGLITINVDEADDPFREKQRLQLGETYRTLLGHFRHEIGHYYWTRLIEGTPNIEEFRALFGDERDDYQISLLTHYEQGPPPDWHDHYVSAYATMHPWEDWAECFAHYLHIVDTLETAQSDGMSIRLGESDISLADLHLDAFDELITAWYPLTIVFNNIARSMGQPDLYPFVLPAAVVEKLRFVDRIVSQAHAPAGCVASAIR